MTGKANTMNATTPKPYDPTPAEMLNLSFDAATRSFHSAGRVVLDLRGVTLTHRVQVAQDTVDADALGIWRNLMQHDLKMSRELADQKRRRLFLSVAPFSTHVEMERDGARFDLGTMPTEVEALNFAAEVSAVYAAHGVPLRVGL